jgi:hypothetical protein
MFRSSLALCAVLLLGTLTSAQCRVTRPTYPPFVPPARYAFKIPNPSLFAYGNDGLWTELQRDGRWFAFGKERDGWVYETKLTFWHRGFDWRKDKPALTVTAKRLDVDTAPVTADHANSVFLPNREAAGMMTLLAVPTLGCWEITAHYESNELSFVVSVEPKPAPMTAEELELYGAFLDSFVGTHGEFARSSLAVITEPLILDHGDVDDCTQAIGFKISKTSDQAAHEFPASITEGRPVYLVDPSGVGAPDRQEGVMSLSRISFDDDHQFAVFTWRFVQAGASGLFYMQGGTLVFRKTAGKWSRSNQTCLGWIT